MKHCIRLISCILVIISVFSLCVNAEDATPDTNKPLGSTEFGGHYYKYFSTQLNQEEAKYICELFGGHLVTVTSKEENEFVASLIPEGASAMTGGHDRESEGIFVWYTGEEFSYHYWGQGQPDNSGGQDALHIYSNGVWDDIYTGVGLGFICEWESWDADNLIPEDATAFNECQYKFYSVKLDWDMAEYFCELLGGHLVVVTSEKENEFVNELAGGNEIWLGGNDVEEEEKFRWVNGEKMLYKNWSHHQPDNWWGTQDHIKMAKNGEWDDDDFSDRQYFVCEWGVSPVDYVGIIMKIAFWTFIIIAGSAALVGIGIGFWFFLKNTILLPAPTPSYNSRDIKITKITTESEVFKEMTEKHYNEIMGITPEPDNSTEEMLDSVEQDIIDSGFFDDKSWQ